MLRVKLITNGSLAIAFDVYLDDYYYAHIEYRKWNNEMRLEHRSGYWFVDETTFKAQQMALEQVTNITVEEEILCD